MKSPNDSWEEIIVHNRFDKSKSLISKAHQDELQERIKNYVFTHPEVQNSTNIFVSKLEGRVTEQQCEAAEKIIVNANYLLDSQIESEINFFNQRDAFNAIIEKQNPTIWQRIKRLFW